MTAAVSEQGLQVDEGVLDARLVACYRAAELLTRGGLAAPAAAAAMAKAQEHRGALVAADDGELPALEAQVTALEAHLRSIDAAIDDATFKAGLSVVTRGGLLGYGRVLLGAPFDGSQRADRFVLLARWLLARDTGSGRLFLPPRDELASLFDQLLVGLPEVSAPERDALSAGLRAQRDRLLMTEDLPQLLESGLYVEIRRARLGAAQLLGDRDLLHGMIALEVDLHNFIEDCVQELQARADDGGASVRGYVEQALSQQDAQLRASSPEPRLPIAAPVAVQVAVAQAPAPAAIEIAPAPVAPAPVAPAPVAPAPVAVTPVAVTPVAVTPVAVAPAAAPAPPPAPASAVVPPMPVPMPAPPVAPAPVALPPSREVLQRPAEPEPAPQAPAMPMPRIDAELLKAALAEETRTLRDAGNEPMSHPMVREGLKKPHHSLPKVDLAPPPPPTPEGGAGPGLEVDVEVGLNQRFLSLAGMIVLTLAALGFLLSIFTPPTKRQESLEGDAVHAISTFLAEGEIRGGQFRGVLSPDDWARLGEVARRDEAKAIAEQLRSRAVYGAEIFRPGADEPSIVIDTTRVMKADP